jgi:hypothetical protein
VLIPRDLRYVSSPLLRARLTIHLLDEPRPDSAELLEIVRSALRELSDNGFTVQEIAAGTFCEVGRIQRLLTYGAE